MWLCQCDCGKQTIVIGSKLQSGNTRSCGCLRRDRMSNEPQTWETIGGIGLAYVGNDIVLVDVDDVKIVDGHYWSINHSGYALARIGGSRIFMHKLLMLSVLTTKQPEVDHISGDKLDNRRSVNLRAASHAENSRNRTMSVAASGYLGVYRKRTKWISQIRLGKDRYHLGTFNTPEEAALAYNEAANKLFGEFASPNRVRYE